GAFSGGFFVRRFTSAGALDKGFGDAGSIRISRDSGDGTILVQKDGKFIVSYKRYDADFLPHPALARFNSDGSIDKRFGVGGRIAGIGGGLGVLQADGRIVTVTAKGIERLDSSGSLRGH